MNECDYSPTKGRLNSVIGPSRSLDQGSGTVYHHAMRLPDTGPNGIWSKRRQVKTATPNGDRNGYIQKGDKPNNTYAVLLKPI